MSTPTAASESVRISEPPALMPVEDSVGTMLEPHSAVFSPSTTVAETIEALRAIVRSEFITYVFVVDAERRLVGVVAMRELLFASDERTLGELMIPNPFFLSADTPILDAIRKVVAYHFPEYPVCDGRGIFLGKVRGQKLFEKQAVEISAQAGQMVGVEKEERVSTPWGRSFKFRHPWLQLNLLTAFVAGAVVGLFQETIDSLVILAVFLPVLAGQSGNTGAQALAVTLRALTLGDLKEGEERRVVLKEALLGLLNGVFVGISAAVGMYILARSQQSPQAFVLSFVVLIAMTASCAISGVSGALVPLLLRRFGLDPATASSIFLSTMTDVVSMGMLLGLATWMVL